MTTEAQKLEKAVKLASSLGAKEAHFRKKADRARSWSNKLHYLQQLDIYREAAGTRCYKLIFKLRDNCNPDQDFLRTFKAEKARWEYENRVIRKEERRKKFLTKHRFEVHYMQRSLSADYGSFRCDRCNHFFYHSPSSIFLATSEIHSCCCGHCTNTIIYKDWGYEPFF